MNDEQMAQLVSDVTKLRAMVSRLSSISVSNSQAVLEISLLLAEASELSPTLREKALDVFKGMDHQIDVLQDLVKISETNNGR